MNESLKRMQDKVIESNKGHWFLLHMEEHLKNNEQGKKGNEITKGKVGCTICGKDVDQIAEETHNKIRNDFKKEMTKKCLICNNDYNLMSFGSTTTTCSNCNINI